MTKKGQRLPSEISAHAYDIAGEQVILAIARDITERKRAEEYLKKSEEKYRAIIETITEVIYTVDVNKIVKDPDLLIKDPAIGALMNAAVTKGSYAKTSYNLIGRGMAGDPKTLLDGIKFMCLLAGGGGGNPNHSWFKYAVSRAVEQANKHIRISGES